MMTLFLVWRIDTDPSVRLSDTKSERVAEVLRGVRECRAEFPRA
jgi:hypothetical protein